MFLGVLAPYTKSRVMGVEVGHRIVNLFQKDTSEFLYKKISRYLVDLINFIEKPEFVISKSLKSMNQDANPQHKRATAYLISGLVKGMGLAHIERLGVLRFCEDCADPKKDKSQKDSALVLVEALLDILDKALEPYIDRIITIIIQYVGDQAEEASARAQAIIKKIITIRNLSHQSVKKVLPLLFKGMQDQNWRKQSHSL